MPMHGMRCPVLETWVGYITKELNVNVNLVQVGLGWSDNISRIAHPKKCTLACFYRTR